MTLLFLVSLIAGLLLGVRIMLFGVERTREFGAEGERSFRLSPPLVTAFLVVFGIAGYVMHRGGVAPMTTVAAAAGLGLVVAYVTGRAVKRWWLVTPEHDVDDERYVLQGHLARVTRSIEGDAEGEVAFEVGSSRRVVRARSIDEHPVPEGTEVVIERIEGDVAYVESWAEVEKRL